MQLPLPDSAHSAADSGDAGMIVELGHLALILAFLVAVVQMVVPMVGASRGWSDWMRVAVPAAVVQFVLTAAAFAALMHAFVVSDFSVRLVAHNSNSAKPLIYKVAGTWGNHEGSMLLWMLILTLFGAMVAWWGGNLPPTLQARVLAVQATIAVAFFGFILFTSNPFLRLADAADRRQRPQPAAAGPRPRLPPAVPLPRLRRPLDGLFLRHRRADRGPGRRRLGALGAALDAARLGVPDHRHRLRLDLGLLRARLGRLVVLGPGRERLASCRG